MPRLLPALMLILLATGCAAPARTGDATLERGPVRIAWFTRELRLVPVAAGGLQAPRKPLDSAATRIAAHVGHPVHVEEPVEISLPTDTNDVLAVMVDELDGRDMIDEGTIVVATFAGGGVTGYQTWRDCRSLAAKVPIVVIHAGAIERRAGLFVKSGKLWEWTLTHEIGHVLGVPASNTHTWIVPGLGGGHCTHPECVMYTGFDWRVLWTGLVRGWPMDFCRLCADELRDARERAAAIPERRTSTGAM